MKKWTDEEIGILKKYYCIKSPKDLLIILSNRTLAAIQIKASDLKLTTVYKKGNAEERFWGYVDKREFNECWNWLGTCNTKGGYGLIGVDHKMIRAHRFSWELHFNKIPDEMCVCHTCDNPPCVNPNHLFLGTQKDNVDDMVSKGRRGGNNKLNLDQVEEIRQSQLLHKELSRKFNISIAAISLIKSHKRWKS